MNFSKAQQQSIEKWYSILEDLQDLDDTMAEPCGFCRLTGHECRKCPVKKQCNETSKLTSKLMNKLVDHIEDKLLPYLTGLKEE